MWIPLVKEVAKSFSNNVGEKPIDWLVVGSVASLLQGCDFQPNDLDIIFPDYASLLAGIGRLEQAGLFSKQDEIHTESFGGGFCWHISRSKVKEAKLDLVFIESGGDIADNVSGDGIWEGGKIIWNRYNIIEMAGYKIPVAPLLIQFESQVRRGQLDRAEAIMRVLKRHGYNVKEFAESLSNKSKTTWQEW